MSELYPIDQSGEGEPDAKYEGGHELCDSFSKVVGIEIERELRRDCLQNGEDRETLAMHCRLRRGFSSSTLKNEDIVGTMSS